MGDRTQIEWTDATWNPTTGCTKVSAGCDHCYAAVLAAGRLADVYLKREPVVADAAHRRDPFAVRLWPERLQQPQKWTASRRIFVNSMSDLFHADVPDAYVRQIFDVMLAANHHIYQVLTKRPARALRFLRRHPDLLRDGTLPRHVWIGVSVENQGAVRRVDVLRDVPAGIRFLSCEPLLGPLTVSLERIDWVIVGGESGIGHRPMQPDWARTLRDQCEAADVPFFFKQWGGRTPKARGRMLDARTWDEYPRLPISAMAAD